MLSAQLSSALWTSAHQEQRQILLANAFPSSHGPFRGCLLGSIERIWLLLLALVFSLPSTLLSIFPSLPCPLFTFFFVPSPHPHTPLTLFLYQFSCFLIVCLSSIWYPPPLLHYFSRLIPSLCHSAFFCLLVSVSVSVFLSFSPPSSFFIPKSSPNLLPLQSQESMGGSGHKESPVLMEHRTHGERGNYLLDKLETRLMRGSSPKIKHS